MEGVFERLWEIPRTEAGVVLLPFRAPPRRDEYDDDEEDERRRLLSVSAMTAPVDESARLGLLHECYADKPLSLARWVETVRVTSQVSAVIFASGADLAAAGGSLSPRDYLPHT